MKNSDEGSLKMFSRLLILLSLLFGIVAQSAVVHATDINSINSNDKRLLRWKYFNDPRAYPLANVPTGAYQRAVSYYDQKWGLQTRPFSKPNALDVTAWTPIGPSPIGTNPTTTGRINSITIDPTNTNVIYLAAATGGVWKSTDGGASWTPKTDTQCSLAMGSVVLDPANPQIVYAGTGEQNFSADSFYGCGVLRSSDGGNTWTRLGGGIFSNATGGATTSRIIVDPTGAGSLTTSKVFAATSFGLFRSTDSGQNWTNTLNGIVTDLAMDPLNSNTLYAAVGTIFGAAENGIYKSVDNGLTWTKLAGGLPTANLGRIEISVAPSLPSTIYAAIQNTQTFQLLGIYKSTDSGATWTMLTAGNANCGSQCWYDLHITVSPASPNTVFFGGVQLFKSNNGGTSFVNVGVNGNVHVDHHFFTFQPGNPSVTYAASDGGIWKSTDSGENWVSLNANLSITQFYGGASLHPTNAATVMGGTQDNGTLTTDGAVAWDQVLTGDGGYTAIDFTDPTTRYAETQWQQGQGFIGPRRSDAGGPYVQKLNGINTNDRGQFIAPITMSPSNPQTLYFGTFRVYRTTDRGENWTAISPDLTTGNGTITAIAQAKTNAQVIYVGANDGSLQVTQNGGTTWTPSTTGLPNRTVKWIAIDPTNPATAFVVFSGFGTGHVFKTTNSGANWINISSDLPDVPVNSIVLDPAAPTTKIYIGTDLGVMGTTNGGTNWIPFNNGMPNVPVFDLVFNPTTNTLVAATHGRGMFKATLGGGGGGTATLVSAVTPVARSTAVNGTVTAFATIINTSNVAGNNCGIALPAGTQNIVFSYEGNGQAGTPSNANTPVAIPANGTFNFILSFRPTATMSTDLALVFKCANSAAAPSTAGLNTFLLTATTGTPADVISIAVTASNDGIANVPLNGTGFAALAAINIGATANLQARLSANAIGATGKTLPAGLFICRTNPDGSCVAPPAVTTDFTLTTGQTATFTALIASNGTNIPFDPANTRLFVHFFQGNDPVGSASVAVRTTAAAKPALALAN